VRAASFKFNLCVHPTDELEIGETDSFNMVKQHLQALLLLEKDGAAWKLKLGKKPQTFSTLGAISDKYYKDKVFQAAVQALVLEQYKETLLFVEESDYSPKNVPPGEVQPIANGE
jgi:hypothetical protein